MKIGHSSQQLATGKTVEIAKSNWQLYDCPCSLSFISCDSFDLQLQLELNLS